LQCNQLFPLRVNLIDNRLYAREEDRKFKIYKIYGNIGGKFS